MEKRLTEEVIKMNHSFPFHSFFVVLVLNQPSALSITRNNFVITKPSEVDLI